MAKEEKGQIIPLPMEIPTIKKIVTCPGCGGKVEVEFEIEMDAVIPALANMGQPEEKKDGKD